MGEGRKRELETHTDGGRRPPRDVTEAEKAAHKGSNPNPLAGIDLDALIEEAVDASNEEYPDDDPQPTLE
ncbi:MAG: hypothetical protein ACLFP8_06820 [Alphaproteobacteria bacterium]